MDPVLDREARRLLDRYQHEVVERFDLCPWAQPARARGEVVVEIVDAVDAGGALDSFIATPSLAICLVVLPRFDGDGPSLRQLRDELLAAGRGAHIAIADFHPAAQLDLGAAPRLVPWLRRTPDPMLQAVRHQTLSSLRRVTLMMSPAEQAAVLAGRGTPPRIDPAAAVADANLATVLANRAAVAAALDDIARDRADTYARLFSTSR